MSRSSFRGACVVYTKKLIVKLFLATLKLLEWSTCSLSQNKQLSRDIPRETGTVYHTMNIMGQYGLLVCDTVLKGGLQIK